MSEVTTVMMDPKDQRWLKLGDADLVAQKVWINDINGIHFERMLEIWTGYLHNSNSAKW